MKTGRADSSVPLRVRRLTADAYWTGSAPVRVKGPVKHDAT